MASKDNQKSVATELTAGSDSAATEHTEEPQLAELVNQEAGLATEIELKVIRNDLVDYMYPFNGKQVPTQKGTNRSAIESRRSVLLGCCQIQRKDKTELKQLQDRWKTGTTWRFKALTLLNDKPAYIHTSCRIAIDLRKSQAQALLQSTSFPQAPLPTVTIADVLQLTQMQRFDLMAIVAKILDERKAGTGMVIADVRLVDGSKDNDSTTTEYAALPLTLFFKDAAELTSFKQYVGKKPLLFMCLTGSKKDGKVSVATIKDQSWRQEAVGSKALATAGEATRMCGDGVTLRDVAAL